MASEKKVTKRLEQHPYVIALLITFLLILWLASGLLKDSKQETTDINTVSPLPQVKVENIQAEQVARTISLYGRTEPDRIVTLQAQVKGAVTQVFAERGSLVKKGDVIATIALNDLPAKLEHFRTLLNQRRIDYYGAKELFKNNYQGESELAKRLSEVTDAKAELALIETDIANTTIKAPFSGILNERYVEVGDYVAIGEDIAMIADLDPLVIRAHITENQISMVNENQTAQIHILNDKNITGKVRYVASVANANTNTFKAEISIENTHYQFFAGVSAEVELPLQMVSAMKVSPALLALDESGNIGIKSVVDDHVAFNPINIVKTDENGVWLSGLGEQMQVITLGQGFVRAGDKVKPILAEQ